MTSSPSKLPTVDKTTAQGRLLANLTAAFYVLFTLLPNSSSLMIAWPFVFIWQVALLTPMFWLLWQIGLGRRWRGLGKYLDAIAVLGILGLFAANLGAVFPNQAHWYGWAAIGVLAGLYALNNWLLNPDDPKLIKQRREGLLIKQGYLSFAFIIISLLIWLTQTLLPYLSQLQQFKQAGVNLSFSFSVLELRNWAPIGHQNYVAGYLVLALPLFALFAFSTLGKKRIFWLIALALGLINLYTTSSRGGWIALIFFMVWALTGLAIQGKINRRLLLGLSAGLGSLLAIILLTNDRLKSSFSGLLQGQGSGEITYRFLNNLIGWRMGSSHPFTGIGLGGVSLNYQKYRPFWAGRESEITYQLHSTPAQLFAEMGIWGILILVATTGGLIYFLGQWLKQNDKLSADFIPVWTISGALFSYGIISLTDYQLDNLCISGFLAIYWVSLVSYQSSRNLLTEVNQTNSLFHKLALPLTYSGLALILAVIIWLFPIQRAWQLSNLGFTALSAKKFPAFVDYLTKANQLAPWESYYPFQLGWNLGDIALMAPNQTERIQLTEAAIAALEKGVKVSPYQEFAYNNLGWLNAGIDPKISAQNFTKALTLVPAKRG
ncbi:MAG: O-antigen ligase family protein, partial [Microcystaceae cyanobacterium]